MRIDLQVKFIKQPARAAIKFFPTNYAKLTGFTSEENVFTNRHLSDKR